MTNFNKTKYGEKETYGVIKGGFQMKLYTMLRRKCGRDFEIPSKVLTLTRNMGKRVFTRK